MPLPGPASLRPTVTRTAAVAYGFGRRARDGCTRRPSSADFGKLGGHGASPRPAARSRASSSSRPASEPARSSIVDDGSPRSRSRAATVSSRSAAGSIESSSSQSNGQETRASGTARTEYADATVRSRALPAGSNHSWCALAVALTETDSGEASRDASPKTEARCAPDRRDGSEASARLVHEHRLGERVTGGREVDRDLVAAQHWKPTLVAAQRNQLPTRWHRISW